MQKTILADTHTHSEYSPDGAEPVARLCQAAEEAGLLSLTLTDHCECHEFEQDHYAQRIHDSYQAAKRAAETAGIELLAGIEMGEAVQDPTAARQLLTAYSFDFVIGSTHAPRGKKDPYFTDFSQVENPYLVLDAYFAEELELAREADFDTLAHLTYPLRYIVGDYGIPIDVSRYAGAIDEIFRTLVRREKALEVNTSGLRQKIGCLLPERDMLLRYRELGGRLVTLGSDAHKSADVGKGLEEGGAALRECGFTHYAVYRQRRPTLYPLAGAASL
ncbi:MAG TPA: histidinol-phosphatase HisJ family protein [Candidatus Caccousia avistercoris]|nr:histidinol-phosphatase HisJ family protein [Candidatus Caccousia avistercoris]